MPALACAQQLLAHSLPLRSSSYTPSYALCVACLHHALSHCGDTLYDCDGYATAATSCGGGEAYLAAVSPATPQKRNPPLSLPLCNHLCASLHAWLPACGAGVMPRGLSAAILLPPLAPAPEGGWNASSPLAAAPRTLLVIFLPRTSCASHLRTAHARRRAASAYPSRGHATAALAHTFMPLRTPRALRRHASFLRFARPLPLSREYTAAALQLPAAQGICLPPLRHGKFSVSYSATYTTVGSASERMRCVTFHTIAACYASALLAPPPPSAYLLPRAMPPRARRAYARASNISPLPRHHHRHCQRAPCAAMLRDLPAHASTT